MKGICSTALVILLSGCVMHNGVSTEPHDPAPDAMVLKGNDITTALVGRPHHGINREGQHYSETFQADGTAIISVTGSQAQGGSWQVSENTLCVNYAVFGNRCNVVKADAKWIWLIDSTKMITNNRISRD